MSFGEPVLIAVSEDRRILTIAGAHDDAEITIVFKEKEVEFSRSTEGAGQLVTLATPLGAWEALGGFTTIRVDGVRVGVSDSLILAERRRLRGMLGRQTATDVSSDHGVSSPDTKQGTPVHSMVPLPVGSRSRDGSAVIGAGGHLFLNGGSNSLRAQYVAPNSPEQIDEFERSVQGWASLVQHRAEVVEGMSVRFLQMFVPDKSSVLDSGVPGLGPVTPLLKRLEDQLSATDHYVSGRKVLLAHDANEGDVSRRWLHLDSHTSARGSYALSRALIDVVDTPSFMDDVEFTGTGTYVGDMGVRFFGAPIPERIETPVSVWLDAADRERTLLEHFAPKRGHRGRIMHWRSPNAPLDAKVLVFGNSFFGARDFPISCNFWVSRAFREHRFVWSAEMDEEMIRAEKPDVVICQTVERFMPRVPAS